MVQLIMGTVQLGIDYGINNKLGKPSIDKALEMLDYAYHNGISILDTANAYGDSEKIIGSYIKETGNEFKIATKLSAFSNSDVSEFVNSQINSSLRLLSKRVIDFYLIHNFSDLIENKDLLIKLKNIPEILSIGVSLYEPCELEYLLDNHVDDIDFVQIPFNILDSRWLKNDLLKKTKENGLKIFVRSIFLQGLIFMEDEDEMNKIDCSLKDYILFINNLAKKKQISMSYLAMDYVKSFKEIDGILFGCETIEQLQENINQFNNKILINDDDKESILRITKDIPERIIDPRKW